jgi:hypothetical protein
VESNNEFIRILQDVNLSVDSISVVPSLLSDTCPDFQSDLIQARKLGRYQGLIHKLIHDLKSGVPLNEIKIKG